MLLSLVVVSHNNVDELAKHIKVTCDENLMTMPLRCKLIKFANIRFSVIFTGMYLIVQNDVSHPPH
jgi:hypothetical protein